MAPDNRPAARAPRAPPVAPLVSVKPIPEVQVTFDQVTAVGETIATPLIPCPSPPDGFEVVGADTCYDISSTATHTGLIEVCITYDENDVGPCCP